jgi:hypothetical protein
VKKEWQMSVAGSTEAPWNAGLRIEKTGEEGVAVVGQTAKEVARPWLDGICREMKIHVFLRGHFRPSRLSINDMSSAE